MPRFYTTDVRYSKRVLRRKIGKFVSLVEIAEGKRLASEAKEAIGNSEQQFDDVQLLDATREGDEWKA